MNPQFTSILTSILMSVATVAATWGVAHGVIPNADQNIIINDLVAAGLAVITGLLGWYKARQASPQAQITAINEGNNGVKVVAASVPESVAPTVVVPLK